MSPLQVIRAWKDENYRLSLTQAQLTQMSAHPAGLIDLTEAELDGAYGGRPSCTCGCTILTPQGRCTIIP